MFSKTIRILIMLTIITATFAYTPTALADEISETKGFRKAVTLAGIREHQAAFQSFADDSGGNRASGTEGFNDSAQYVYDLMAAAGYNVSFQEFPFAYFEELSPAILEQTAPGSVSYANGVDFLTMTYSGSGDVTASVTAVDTTATAGASTSGCETSDFAGFPTGNIALIQRGTCTFALKATNAQAAGASGVIVFNQGIPGRVGLFGGTLGSPVVTIPVVSISFTLGVELYNLIGSGLQMHMVTDTISEFRPTVNVIAETPRGDPNRVIVIGAHLDSVGAGPGINDNGSGSAALLEIAEVFAAQGRVPRNKLRFMWYAAEEAGLVGSTLYVNSLSQAEREKIEMMLNFDMIGSPNFMRGVYDGDNSAFPPGPNVQPGPPGSGTIEQVFVDYFNSQGLYNEPTPFSGRSDYGPFITNGIPAGGLFTGAEGLKTAFQVEKYGGIEDEQYDPCYHEACDTFEGTGDGSGATPPGLGLVALDQMSDAAAHAVLLFSKRNFDQAPLVNPVVAASAASSSGSILHTEDQAREEK